MIDIIELDDDGYPTDESLEKIEKLEHEEAERFVASLPDIKLPYASIHKYEEDGEARISYSTGGWSGNESIINAMLKNFYINQFMYYSWHRGGHHVFDLKGFGIL